MSTFAVILPAAGKSSRFHDKHYKKPYAPLNDRAVWLHSADRFLNRDDVKQVIIVISAEDREDFQMKFGANIAILGVDVVEGGNERAESVSNALASAVITSGGIFTLSDQGVPVRPTLMGVNTAYRPSSSSKMLSPFLM